MRSLAVVSKGTLRFLSDKPLPKVLVRKLVKARLAENAVLDNPSGKITAEKKSKKTLAPAPSWTPRQGQFALTPPSVHDAIVRMHKRGLIDRTPGQARSIRVLVPDDEIPQLEDKTTPQAPARPLSRKQKEETYFAVSFSVPASGGFSSANEPSNSWW